MDIFILWLPPHILGICSSWKLMLCHKMIVYFCHRIASECMMVISSGQCVFVVSLFIDSGSVLFLPIVNTGHRPLTRDTWRVETTRQLQLTAADTGCGYGETDGAWWLLWWLLSSITCVLVHPRNSPVTMTLSLVFVGPGPVHESLSLEFFNFNINIQWCTKYYKTYCKR